MIVNETYTVRLLQNKHKTVVKKCILLLVWWWFEMWRFYNLSGILYDTKNDSHQQPYSGQATIFDFAISPSSGCMHVSIIDICTYVLIYLLQINITAKLFYDVPIPLDCMH